MQEQHGKITNSSPRANWNSQAQLKKKTCVSQMFLVGFIEVPRKLEYTPYANIFIPCYSISIHLKNDV